MKILCVDPALADKVWPFVSDLVRQGISYGCEDLEETRKKIFSGLWLLWLAYDGVVIKGIAVTGLYYNSCEIIAAAGKDFRLWGHLISDLEAYARAEKRDCMRLIGRKGWERMLKGYKRIGSMGDLIMLERPL